MGSEMESGWLIFIKGRLCCLFTLPREYKSLLSEGEQFAYLMFIAHALTRNYKGNKLGVSPLLCLRWRFRERRYSDLKGTQSLWFINHHSVLKNVVIPH